MQNKPFAESCEENKQAILEVIAPLFQNSRYVLEIGSGTGQHAVYFAASMPHLVWQTSDREEHHPGIRAWLRDDGPPNALPPLSLDVESDAWPDKSYDAVFSANTAHIMSVSQVEAMFRGVAGIMAPNALFALYGPFNYDARYTSDSNARFDQWLKGRDPLSGIKNFEHLDELARKGGLEFKADYEMPANNRILLWWKPA